MQKKNPLFLNIDLTLSSPKIKETHSNISKGQKNTSSITTTPQLFIQSPQFKVQLSRQDRTKTFTPTKSQTSLGKLNSQEEQSIISRVTGSSHSPASKQGIVLKTDPSYQKLAVQEKLMNTIKSPTKEAQIVRSFVKDNKNSYYYQIDQRKQSSNSRSITPKSRQSSQKSPNIKIEKSPSRSENNHKKDEGNLRIKIFIRVKPSDSPSKNRLKIINQKQIVISSNDDMVRNFEFNRVLDSLNQEQVYLETSKLMIDRAINGKGNGIAFTYGQTGSGKTYTMGLLQDIESPEQGLVSLGLHDLFNQLKVKQDQGLINSHQIELSFIQIYMEEVSDLLNPQAGPLQIREYKENQKPYVQGVIQVEIQNVEEGYQLIGAGIRHRIVASQSLNKNSSRSHTLLIFTIHQIFLDQQGLQIEQENKVTFVDLAGSERIKKSNSKQISNLKIPRGIRIDEAKAINSSLSSLGNVIQALGNPNQQHIPFRDSKLTRILQAYMDGESSVSLICTISQQQDNVNETLSTLMFAQRCKDVVLRSNLNNNLNQANSNYSNIQSEKEIDYQRQIKSLKEQIKQMQESTKNSLYFNHKISQEDSLQDLVDYLFKIIQKVKQYTQTLSDQISQDYELDKANLKSKIQEQGYQFTGSTKESQLISNYVDCINYKLNFARTVRDLNRIQPLFYFREY